mmetsp:Transcript_65730/g.208029  ORF Transcript_65730/g.208029 Transcript_65730/m.208029 type:complete len:110 (+) Transcript_65730:532-861(+)
MAVGAVGGVVARREERYLYATFTSSVHVDDVEFYLPAGDSTVEVRSAARRGGPDLGRNSRRLGRIRELARLQEVPILCALPPLSHRMRRRRLARQLLSSRVCWCSYPSP